MVERKRENITRSKAQYIERRLWHNITQVILVVGSFDPILQN